MLQYGTFGYNCGLGQCDFINTPEHEDFPQTFFVAIAYYIPFIVIVSSYFIIWIYVRHSTKYLRAAGSGANMQQLNARDLRMTWTILLVCFSYFIFVTPGILLSVLVLKTKTKFLLKQGRFTTCFKTCGTGSILWRVGAKSLWC